MTYQLLLALLVMSLPLQGLAANREDSNLAVFVGRFESIQELPNVCEGKKDCISIDMRYSVTYQVLETIKGSVPSEEVSFEIFDHYGLPDFTRYKNALLFVEQSKDGNYLQKYHGFVVDPTADGSWAYCGRFSFGDTKVEAQDLSGIKFAPDVVFGAVGSLNAAGIREQYDPNIFSIRDGLVYCNKGIRAEAIVSLLLGKAK